MNSNPLGALLIQNSFVSGSFLTFIYTEEIWSRGIKGVKKLMTTEWNWISISVLSFTVCKITECLISKFSFSLRLYDPINVSQNCWCTLKLSYKFPLNWAKIPFSIQNCLITSASLKKRKCFTKGNIKIPFPIRAERKYFLRVVSINQKSFCYVFCGWCLAGLLGTLESLIWCSSWSPAPHRRELTW